MIRAIFIKSLKEQLRNIWVLVLTLSLAPFFVFIYYLINEASQPSYNVLLFAPETETVGLPSASTELYDFLNQWTARQPELPLKFRTVRSRTEGLELLESRRADVLLIAPVNFTESLQDSSRTSPHFEIVGDLTQTGYLIGAIWVGELVNEFITDRTGHPRLYTVTETALGHSGELSEFDMWIPGMLVLSIIMLMFSATITFVAEVDQKTILRLKLSRMKAWHFLGGVGLTQLLVGLASILLTLLAALSLGFESQGAWLAFLLIAVLTSLSMISFSLILAAFTRSITDVLIIGNFPLFLFMFFTGAAFPITAKPWFHLWDYPVSWQSLLSPTHGIAALHKISILGLGLTEVLPEILMLILMTLVYLFIGILAFDRRHLRTT